MRRAVARVSEATAAVSDNVIIARSPLKARMTVRPLASVVMNSRSGSPSPGPAPRPSAPQISAALEPRIVTPLAFVLDAEVFVDTARTLPDNDR